LAQNIRPKQLRQLGDIHCNPSRTGKVISVTAVTALAVNLPQHAHCQSWDTAMKALVLGIAFAAAIIFTSQAFAADLPDCPNVKWKHGHYICDEANS
jgi:hypothetical protein